MTAAANGARGGWSWGVTPETRDIMADPGYSPTPQEALVLGVGKAHRNVVYCHYDMRNFQRSHLGTTGRVPR